MVLGTVWLACDINVGIRGRESWEVGTLNTGLRNLDLNSTGSGELVEVCDHDFKRALLGKLSSVGL